MEEKNLMAFRTEDGDKIEFEVIAKIFLNEDTVNEKEYILLSPLEETATEVDMFVVRVDEGANGIEYNFIEDDKEFLEVKKAYKDLAY